MPKVTMPQLGESVAEGTIGKWLKQVGDHVDKYEPIVEVITDKVNAEVPSPFEGTLTEILVKEGETVPNNAEIATVEGANEEASAAAPETSASGSAADSAVATGPNVEEAEGQEATPETAPQKSGSVAVKAEKSNGAGVMDRTILGMGSPGPAGSDEGAERSGPPDQSGPEHEGRMTPAVRRLAREHGVDLSLIKGTGHSGRVTREDVLAFVEQQRPGGAGRAVAPEAAAAPGAAAASPRAAAAATTGAPPPPRAAKDELKPTTPMRRAIAEQMVRSKQSAPHAYTTVEVDVSGMVALRESVKSQYQVREGIALSYVAIVAKAVVEGLRRHPDLNAHWTHDGLLRRRAINLGIAVAVDDGLIVPVIRNADQLSIHGLNLQVQDFASRARTNKLKLDDIQGGTFTLNNTGWFGSVASQPIINVPEIAILSMEAIVKRPLVIETPQGDTIGIRPIMNVCVSFDHRGTDGAQVGRFVQEIRGWLESLDTQTPVW
ncbi:MAG: dihydrolipoamide acetyltransferase family protein [Candidatus Limnocylindrales bacterium]